MASRRGGADRRSAAPQRGDGAGPANVEHGARDAGTKGGAGGGRAAAASGVPARANTRDTVRNDPGSVARAICLRLLQVRPRTRVELETALRRSGVAKETVAEVLDRYSEVGMIDDEAFARAWVTSRHHSRGLAGRALAGELRRKGVSDEAVGAAVDDLDAATEAATARALVERRLRTEMAASRSARPGARTARRKAAADASADHLDGSDEPGSAREERQREEAALARKLVGMLARKGYPPGLAYRVVREALAEKVGMTDTEALADLDQTDDDFDEFDQVRS